MLSQLHQRDAKEDLHDICQNQRVADISRVDDKLSLKALDLTGLQGIHCSLKNS